MAASTPRGISYPTSGDKIKDGSSPSALAADFAGTAVSADVAISQGVQEAKEAAALDATTKANQAKTEAVTESKAYTDQVVDTSHLALDRDGTPYYSPGSMTLRVFTDTDGNPFFLDA